MTEELKTISEWDESWEAVKLPSEKKQDPRNPRLNQLLGVFDRYFPPGSERAALEVGGAPGGYLA